MRKSWIVLCMVACLAASALAQENFQIHALVPFNQQALAPQVPTISYNGGPVFESTPNVYIVYYGNFKKKDHTVVNGFFSRLGNTTMNEINTTYSDDNNIFVPNSVGFAAANTVNDAYSLGKSVRDPQIRQIVANAIAAGSLPNDTNGIYFVLTATDVADPDGQCTQFCGYHGPANNIVSGEIIKYSMVGNPARCPSACEASAVLGDSGSPNGDPGADGAINIMWHEFSETVTDPQVNLNTAWAGNNCGENGDCCAWQFGNTFRAKNGHIANEHLGKKYYITQMMLELNQPTRGQNEPGTCRNTFQ